jgi:hypothetical protein
MCTVLLSTQLQLITIPQHFTEYSAPRFQLFMQSVLSLAAVSLLEGWLRRRLAFHAATLCTLAGTLYQRYPATNSPAVGMSSKASNSPALCPVKARPSDNPTRALTMHFDLHGTAGVSQKDSSLQHLSLHLSNMSLYLSNNKDIYPLAKDFATWTTKYPRISILPHSYMFRRI